MAENIFLFWPNVIGYFRLITAVLACFFMPSHPVLMATFYTISCLLDAVDGYLARALNQCTKFGSVLDMVLDRSTTACLMCFLVLRYPNFLWLVQLLLALDLSSHYMQMYTSLATGSTSHKSIDMSKSFLLRLYYHNRGVLFFLCAANELFWLSLYLISFGPGPIVSGVDLWVAFALFSGPFCFIKHLMNLIQLISASMSLAEMDLVERAATKAKKA